MEAVVTQSEARDANGSDKKLFGKNFAEVLQMHLSQKAEEAISAIKEVEGETGLKELDEEVYENEEEN